MSLFPLILLILAIRTSEQCTSGDYMFESYLGVRTPYRLVANKTLGELRFDGCQAKKAWMIVRHGTRNPSAGSISKMRERLPILRDQIEESPKLPNDFVHPRDLDLFRKWKLRLDEDDGDKLVHEGEEENLLMAERMQHRFPTVFDAIYSNTSFQFKFTHTQRAKKSCLYFIQGLFGKSVVKSVWLPQPLKKDPILRFYKNCDRWLREIKRNPTAMKEHLEFVNGSQLKRVASEISTRLGLEKLSIEDLRIVYQTCAFETAWNKVSKSPWCSIFAEKDLKVLEYLEDLNYYWQDGYGHEITYKQACPAFNDMIQFLNNKEKYSKVSAYFTHSGTILKILAHLGLYKDQNKLTAKNFDKMANYRLWRTSLIDSFAANLAFIAFDCDGSQKLLTLHQEKIVRLPSCPNSDLCDLERVKSFYSNSLNECDFDSLCNVGGYESNDESSSSSTDA